MATAIELSIIAEQRCFGGTQLRFKHRSNVLDCEMRLSVYLPSQAEQQPVSVLWWLSGLTCTDQNFTTKAGAQRYAAEHGIALISPDTSPRGEQVPDDPQQAYDFGLGAGFYLNATQKPWSDHYRMYDYLIEELPPLLFDTLPLDPQRQAISGHSMGGHGALILALKNPERYRSVSAFAPICAPSQCPWGQKAFSGYLGEDKHQWLAHDSVALLPQTQLQLPLLIDQGEADEFLKTQLKPELLQQVAAKYDYPLTLRLQPDYDHSYFFIASFIGEHIAFHARHLNS